jgi:hypothetical protein
MVPTLTDQLEAKLRGIDAYYPGTHYACLMDADGRVSGSTHLHAACSAALGTDSQSASRNVSTLSDNGKITSLQALQLTIYCSTAVFIACKPAVSSGIVHRREHTGSSA